MKYLIEERQGQYKRKQNNKTYRVKIAYEGAMNFDIKATNKKEAQRIAIKHFDDTSDNEIVTNLDEIVITGVSEIY